MSVISKAQLKNDFLTDKVITQPKMEDLIDSCYNDSGTGSYGLPYEVKRFTKVWDKTELIALCSGNVTEELIPAVAANEAILPLKGLNFYDYGASTNPLESQAGGAWQANSLTVYFTNQTPSWNIMDMENWWGGGGGGVNVASSYMRSSNDLEVELVSGWHGSGISINVNNGGSPQLVDNGGGNVATMSFTLYYRIITDWQF